MLPLAFGRRVVLATDPDIKNWVKALEFRLTYDGCLLSTGNTSRPDHVHRIRRRFHPQLRRLWDVEESLNLNEGTKTIRGTLEKKFERNGYNFVPVSVRDYGWVCALHILLLRPKPLSRAILSASDLDGQLATLFDALSMPRHADQLRGNETPQEDEKPFYVLMEDDSMVTDLSVETGILLEETRDGIDRNAARAVITANVHWPPRDLGWSKWT